MKAVVCKEHGPAEKLVLEDVAERDLFPGEIRVEVKAAGVNFPDTLIIENKYQFKPDLPFTPGSEAAGVVIEVGEGVDAVSVGDGVMALCGIGGFAERLIIPATSAIPMPAGMGFDEAAGFIMTYATSHYALVQRAQLQAGETLLVLGAGGGVGLAAVELGHLLGARVIAAASSDEKLEVCRRYGADEVINYSSENLKERTKELTGGAGADVIYDPVGGDLFDQSLRCIAWEGRLLVIGFASGRIPTPPANLVLLKSCQIVGVFWGAFTARDPKRNQANLAELARFYEEGRLKPFVSARYQLADVAEALNSMIERRVIGKVVLTNDQ